jgi:peptidyl-prolyl cis-trans isomerase C
MSKRKNRVAIAATLSLAVCLSFNARAQSSPADLTVERGDESTVVVRQGDVELTLGDVDTWMLEVPEKDRAGFIRSPERIENMLFQLLAMKQLNLEARKAGLDQQPYVARHMKFASERTLARYHTDAVRRAIKAPNLSELAREKYLADPEVYREQDVGTVTHLLITTTKRGADEAERLIRKLRKQALKNPERFAALIAKHSEDPSAAVNEGTIKNVALDKLDPAFAEAARKLEPGQFSEPVKSEFGWHIIRLDAITRGRIPSFEELKDSIEEAAAREYADRTFRGYMNDLRQRAMEPNAEVLERLPFRYGELTEAPQPASAEQPASDDATPASKQ